MADTIKTNLGPVTAYADAKAHGYTGTREEFGQLLANAGLNLKAAETAKEGAEAAKQAAETAQQAAAENQKNAGTQAANAKASADTAAGQADAAKESATGAANSASAAQKSETNAGLSATAAANAEAAAKQAQQAAETAKTDAEASKTAAGTSADAAAASAADAKKTLESIPADYSALSGKVDENASGIRELKEDLGNALQTDIIPNNNLWGLSDWSQTLAGVAISYDSKTGIFTFNGTGDTNTDKFVFSDAQISPLLETGTYKIWCKTISGSLTGKNPTINFGTGLATVPINYNSSNNLFSSLTLTGTQNRYKIGIIGGTVFYNLKLHIWVTSVDITNETDLGFQKYGEIYKTPPILNPNISIQRLDSHIENSGIHLSVAEKAYVAKAVSDKQDEDIFDSEIADTIEKTFTHQKNKNLCFAYMSDSHTYMSNPDSVKQYKGQIKNIAKVNELVSYDFLVHCGDFVNTQWLWVNSMISDNEYQKYVRQCVMELNTIGICNVFPVMGNHDSGFIPSTDPKTHGTEYSGYLANARTMGKILNNKSIVTKNALKPYYYVDFEIYKIRCVYISTDCDSLKIDAKGIPYEESTWFKNVLETTPDDFNILLFGHIPFSRFTMGETTSSFLNLVNGFNTHTIVDNTGTGMDADFTGRTSKILAYICGHYHGDSVVTPDSEYSVMNCPEITIGAGGYLSSSVITSGNRYDDLDAPSRELGTITQDLWDSCVLDLEENILYLTRFGAGNDRIVNLN